MKRQPATDVLEWMSKQLPKFGGVVVQAEDELAAITMTLGAAFAGVRAMTATSGPGQALMTEAIGLAGVLEIPGVVLAPGTVRESFELTATAFNLAEKYQLPVFVLTEQALCQSKATLAPLDIDKVTIDRGKLIDSGEGVFGEYKRFAFTEDGVSPRVIPGVPGGMHLAPGSEHNDAGVITENPRNRARMMEKRMGKLETMRPDLPRAVLHGIADADIAILGYGANRGPIAEAVQRLAADGVLTRFLQLRTLWPFPDDDIKELLRGAPHVFVVENNYTGQLMQLIRAVVGPLDALHGLRKYDGRPFRPIEIIDEVKRFADVADPAEVS